MVVAKNMLAIMNVCFMYGTCQIGMGRNLKLSRKISGHNQYGKIRLSFDELVKEDLESVKTKSKHSMTLVEDQMPPTVSFRDLDLR
jgi:hypothetical protein